MIKTIVVLSAPSTASSLVAECLNTKIHMGHGFRDNGHFEDPEMLQLSQDILAHAREIDEVGPLFSDYTPRLKQDPWDNPPSEQAILDCGPLFKERIISVINNKRELAVECDPPPNEHGVKGNPAKFWGWKDGRVGWVIPIIAPYLENPHYMVLHRDYDTVSKAIARRLSESGSDLGVDRAMILVREMYKRIFKFMANQ